MATPFWDLRNNPWTKYGGGASLSALAGLGVKQYQQRASDINQIKNYLHQNLGGPLSQAQRTAIQFGAKIPNRLFQQAYDQPGSWWKYLTARTTPGHFGPVEAGWRGAKTLGKYGGRFLGASAVPLLAGQMLGKEAGQEKLFSRGASGGSSGWQQAMIDPTFSGLPRGMKGGLLSEGTVSSKKTVKKKKKVKNRKRK